MCIHTVNRTTEYLWGQRMDFYYVQQLERSSLQNTHTHTQYIIQENSLSSSFFTGSMGRSEVRLSRNRWDFIFFKDSSTQKTQSNLQPHAYKMVFLRTPVTKHVICSFCFKINFLRSLLEVIKRHAACITTVWAYLRFVGRSCVCSGVFNSMGFDLAYVIILIFRHFPVCEKQPCCVCS